MTLDQIIGTPVQPINASTRYGTAPLREPGSRKWCAPRIECSDGESLSVQAHELAYCTPKNNRGPWTHVEVGFLSTHPGDQWAEYSDGSDVYGYVPVKLVRDFTKQHGGEGPVP